MSETKTYVRKGVERTFSGRELANMKGNDPTKFGWVEKKAGENVLRQTGGPLKAKRSSDYSKDQIAQMKAYCNGKSKEEVIAFFEGDKREQVKVLRDELLPEEVENA